ncbi:sucrose nonfermenting 4-like protein isoform X5 [Quercus robur]|uniref:sucrose nonfermenting 4-like protein isoform X5 n=1 Tax=Quercus robur TaxID=38942 RepID=UPI002161473E|nr:sucrose nonfermenting 4-like protein isoform X5 [Quercus robur]
MFGSVPDRGHDSSGISVPVLIPYTFLWRNGGRSVALCGTFTRWSGSIPMSPVEGRDDVFQVVCNLTPGNHQYKFCVDGVWRHDESQPFIPGEYGLVNTILIREPDMIPSTYSHQPPDIDMDYDVVMPPEAVPRISVTDLEVSRHRISLFLSTHNAYELLPESGKIIALDVNLPVKQAFHILFEQLGSHGSNLTEEELETHTIAAWKEGGKLHLTRTMDGNGASFSRRHLVHAGPNDCLKDVALKILQNKVATVPIIHFSLQDGSVPQLLHLASLSGILKCIYRYFRHSSSSLPILQQPICSIPCGTWVPKIGDSKPFAMLRPNASLSAALALLVQAGVSSIPIVDDNGSLLDIYSRSDITALAKDKVYAQIRLDEMSILEALRLGQDANSPHGVFNGQRCQMCLRSDPLHEVMKRLANPGVRRLIIVEAGSNRVEGIISLSDVFKFLLGYPEFVGHHFT